MSKVLILSKKPLLSRKSVKALAKAGVRVREASKYKEDLWKNAGGDYDIVVVDEAVFGGDAKLAASQIHGVSQAIIILLGEAPSWDMWDRKQEMGVDHYCRKPLQPGDLEHRVKLANCELEYHRFREKLDSLSARLPAQTEPEDEAEGVAEAPAAVEAPPPVAAPEPRPIEAPGPAGEPPVAQEEPVAREAPPVIEPEATPPPETHELPGDESAPAPAGSTNIWQEPRAARLVSSLLSGKTGEIKPEIDLRLKDGFTYPEADDIMGTSGKETAAVLETLASEGILARESYEEVLSCPSGSMQLIPVERCPHCDSDKLTRGQLIEHFSCGFIGPEEEFSNGLNLICPKCQRELKLIGTDYRKPGMRYVCNSCQGVFPSPVVKCRDLKTGDIYSLEELRRLPLYRYRLNEAHRRHLEFELEPKRQLIDYLTRLGYEVNETVSVKGRSGATHTIDLLARMQGLITRNTVAVGILSAPREGESVSIDALFGFDSKIYDTGIESKMVIAVPYLNSEAMKFAERQGIRVYSIEDLRTLLREPPVAAVTGQGGQPDSAGRPIPAGANPGDRLQWLLEDKGYTVRRDYRLTGRSGAEHTLEFYAQKDDGIVNHRLAVCIINGESDDTDVNAVMRFDTAAYDARIRDKVIVNVPELSREAKQFADYQRIKVVRAAELFELSGRGEDREIAYRYGALADNH
jgi:DNA-binding NarL/FixJ family response regulator